MNYLHCFKAYDIRGKVPQDLSPSLVRALGKSLRILGGNKVVIGHDARLSSPHLLASLMEGLQSWGAEIFNAGLCGTEEIYYLAASMPFDLGIMITGSHNPDNENGFKIIRGGAIPVSADSGLKELEVETRKQLANSEHRELDTNTPSCQKIDTHDQFLGRLMDISGMRKGKSSLRLVIDCGNGCAGPVLEKLVDLLPFDIVLLNPEPDGHFPNGVPNPLLPENRKTITRAIAGKKADVGIAFDGDFDRCFFYDHSGAFISGAITAAILARQLLAAQPGEKIIHDTRLYWNIRHIVEEGGGLPVMSKCGHAFIKERMRKENALFGGENSGHYFYRDFAFCDSGMLTMLLTLAFLQNSSQNLAAIRESMNAAFPAIEEKNYRIDNAPEILEAVWQKYRPQAVHADKVDGINLEFPNWRFNLRASNTENLLRLNMESRADAALLENKLAELNNFIVG